MGNGNVALQADTGNSISGSKIHFFVDNSEKMILDDSGRLLLGRTSVSNSDSTMEIQGSTDTYLRIASGNTGGSAGVVFGSSDDHSTGGICLLYTSDAADE